MTTDKAIRILQEHSFPVRIRNGRVEALVSYTKHGIPGSEWEIVPMNREIDLYQWIGY